MNWFISISEKAVYTGLSDLIQTSSELFQDKERSITQIHKCQQHIKDEITKQISYDDTNRMNSNHTFNALKVL